VGADRGLKRLRVWTLSELELEPAGDGAAGQSAPEDTSLRDALSMMLVEGAERLTVLDSSGAPKGTVTLETITRLIGPEKRTVGV
jgi:osmoprotectant transport system ATP-binding protein